MEGAGSQPGYSHGLRPRKGGNPCVRTAGSRRGARAVSPGRRLRPCCAAVGFVFAPSQTQPHAPGAHECTAAPEGPCRPGGRPG